MRRYGKLVPNEEVFETKARGKRTLRINDVLRSALLQPKTGAVKKA